MLKTIVYTLLILFSVTASSVYSAEDNYTPEQKKEIAQFMGIILVGFSKQDVQDTFSSTKPDIWYTDAGQEVWYYPAPEAQNIYFNGDKVENVEFTTQKHRTSPPGKIAL